MAITATVQATRPTTYNGVPAKQVRAQLALDNAYPVAGYTITPAMFGLTMFALLDSGAGFVDPVVTGVNQGGVLAEIKSQKLLLSYPTGGATAAPATPAAPKSTSGASTASAVNATTPDITPGLGKAFVNNADASTLTVFAEAFGF